MSTYYPTRKQQQKALDYGKKAVLTCKNKDPLKLAASKLAEEAVYATLKLHAELGGTPIPEPPEYLFTYDSGYDIKPNWHVKAYIDNAPGRKYPISWLFNKTIKPGNVALCIADYNLQYVQIKYAVPVQLIKDLMKPSISIKFKNALYLEDLVANIKDFEIFCGV